MEATHSSKFSTQKIQREGMIPTFWQNRRHIDMLERHSVNFGFILNFEICTQSIGQGLQFVEIGWNQWRFRLEWSTLRRRRRHWECNTKVGTKVCAFTCAYLCVYLHISNFGSWTRKILSSLASFVCLFVFVCLCVCFSVYLFERQTYR